MRKANKIVLIIWAVLMAALSALDIITTYMILEDGGSERNRLFSFLIENLGSRVGILVLGSIGKAFAVLASYFVMRFLFRWVESDKTNTQKEKLLLKILLYFGMAAILYVFLLPAAHNLALLLH